MKLRRFFAAIAAVAAVGFPTILAMPEPAAAAPADLCTVKEWQDPSRFSDCASRLGNAVSQRAECLNAPAPSLPDSGAPGWFTSRPEADLRSGVSGNYTHYGVGGYQLDTYDVSCAGGIAHPDAVAENSVASMEFTAAATVIGAANGLREHAYDPGSMWGWSDGFVKSATQAAYHYVFTIFGVVSLVLAGLWLIWRARRGDLSETVKVAGWAMLVMVAITGLARYPVAAAHGADRVSVTGLTAMHSVLGPPPVNTPPDQCPFPDDRNACIDHRSVANRASDTVTDAILYRNWLRALLGSADSPTAQKYGPALYDATTLSWGEAADIRAHPDLQNTIIQEKARRWITIAEAIKAEDPEAYANLQGLRGVDRVGSGFVALLSAVVFAAFDMAASLVILFGFLVFRVAVVAAPVIATVGILQPASAGVRRLFHAVVSSVVNIVLFGAGAGLYLMVVDKIFATDLPGAAQIFGVLLTGLACFLLLRPARRLIQVSGRSRSDTGAGDSGWWRRRGAHDVPQPAPASAPQLVPAVPSDPGRRPRPETTAGSRA